MIQIFNKSDNNENKQSLKHIYIFNKVVIIDKLNLTKNKRDNTKEVNSGSIKQ